MQLCSVVTNQSAKVYICFIESQRLKLGEKASLQNHEKVPATLSTTALPIANDAVTTSPGALKIQTTTPLLVARVF